MNKYWNYLIACLLSLATLSSCSDDNKPAPDPVLTPIAKHIIGKWKLVEQVIKKDGEWVDVPSTGTFTITFRPDGTLPESISPLLAAQTSRSSTGAT